MKTFFVSLALTVTAGLFSVGYAQSYMEDPRFGSTPEEREKTVVELNYLRDKINLKDYDGALQHIRNLISIAPKASANIYIWGVTAYKAKQKAAETDQDKVAYADSVIMMYDLRAENFGDDPERGKAYIFKWRARDYGDLFPEHVTGILRMMKEAINVVETEMLDPEYVNDYVNVLTGGYSMDSVSTSAYLDEIMRLMPIMQQLGDEEQFNIFQHMFVTSGAANCDNLEKIYRERLEQDPDNIDLIKETLMRLERANCTKSEFFFEVAGKYHEISPSSASARFLSNAYQNKGDDVTARKFLDEAIALEEDPVEKARLTLSISAMQLEQGHYSQAFNTARTALAMDPSNGMGYYIQAMAYGRGSRGCGEPWQQRSVNWLVVDLLQRARPLVMRNPDMPLNLSVVDSTIASYSGQFPDQNDMFWMQGPNGRLQNGDRYTVKCGWISGETTARMRK